MGVYNSAGAVDEMANEHHQSEYKQNVLSLCPQIKGPFGYLYIPYEYPNGPFHVRVVRIFVYEIYEYPNGPLHVRTVWMFVSVCIFVYKADVRTALTMKTWGVLQLCRVLPHHDSNLSETALVWAVAHRLQA